MSIRLFNPSGGFIDLNAGGDGTAANVFTLPAETGTLLTTASAGSVSQTMLATGVSTTGPTFGAYRSGSTQSISSGAWTKIQFNGEDWDTASCFDSTTNYRFTPNVAGYYQITLRYSLASGTPTRQIMELRKNGSSHRVLADLSLSSGTFADGFVAGTAMCYMNGTTDYIESYVYLAGAGNVNYGSDNTYFQGFLARAA